MKYTILMMLWVVWCNFSYTFLYRLNEKTSKNNGWVPPMKDTETWPSTAWAMWATAPVSLILVIAVGLVAVTYAIFMVLIRGEACYTCKVRGKMIYSPLYDKSFCTTSCFETWMVTAEGQEAFQEIVKSKVNSYQKEEPNGPTSKMFVL